MNVISLKIECEECGGDAYVGQVSKSNEVNIDFLEDTPFACECGAETYLEIEKRTESANAK